MLLYFLACGETRVGTFDGAYLQRTLDADVAIRVIDMYRDKFPTIQHRQWAFEALWEIDKIATEVRGKEEQVQRKIKAKSQELQQPQRKRR